MRSTIKLLIILLFISLAGKIKGEEKEIVSNTKELIVDHIMFPVYNNDPFLDEMQEIWETKNIGEVERADYDAYSAVFFKSKEFYVEYLSTNKGDGWWRNKVYIVVDKKFWDYYESPFIKDDFFLVPERTSGYALISPEYNALSSKVNQHIEYEGFTILISEELKSILLNICGLKWELPPFIKTNKNLIHETDMVVIDEEGEYIAPFLECNPVWIYK